jgi:two-component system response regulator HydG
MPERNAAGEPTESGRNRSSDRSEPSEPEPVVRRILLVDDDRVFRRSTAELLRQDGYEVTAVEDAARAGEALSAGAFDLMLLDLRMPELDGLQLIEILRRRGNPTPILMISGFGTIESAVESLHLGADDFLTKPVDPEELSLRVAELLDRLPPSRQLEAATFRGIVGRSRAMCEVFEEIRRVAPTDATVLVTGETGTGKELVARAIHTLSSRSSRPFVAVNCASLADGVLESELFGHVRGAFTGAVRDKKGLFSAAEGGSLLLDEIGDMSLRLQQRLLRVLQEREVLPVGATRPASVDVRVIASTHRALQEETRAGRFRKDLFYRLNVFLIHLPPLRERGVDIPLLVQVVLERLRGRFGGSAPRRVSTSAMRILRGYAWPGNVRELFSALESAAIRAGGGPIETEHLPQEIRSPGGDGTSTAGRYERQPAEEERETIRTALEECGGVRRQAAKMLGMSRTTLWRKMREYGLE